MARIAGPPPELRRRLVEAGVFHTYESRTDPIEVTSLGPHPDQTWTYCDAKGHEHSWATHGETWANVQDDPDEPPFYFDADGEEYNAPSSPRCLTCGEVLDPATVGPFPFQQFIAGETHYLKDGEPISQEEFEHDVELGLQLCREYDEEVRSRD